MAKEVLFEKAARDRIKKGLDIACNAIKSTIGPKGRNAFIDNEVQPKITNDGVTIAHAITLEDKFENMGAWLVKNTSAQTDDDAGDGTSTTAVLLQSIIDESLKRPENVMDIKRALGETGKRIEAWITESAKPVEDSQIEAVATISSESKTIGKLIAEVIAKVGKNVPVYIEDNKFSETEYSVVEGLETKVGYAHNVFVSNPKDNSAEMENVHVFASDRRVSSLTELKTLLDMAVAQKITSVVFLVSDIDNSVLGQFVLNKQMGAFNSLIIKVRGHELEDMAAVSGATVISESSGIKFTDVKMEHLGKVKKITATDKKTLILGNQSETRDKAVQALRLQAEQTKNMYEAKHYNKRADALQGGVAVIKVGAHTDSEREYLKYKIEDAINATKSAIEEGLVEGGGMCLYRLANKLKGKSIGEVILKEALKAPLKAIIENAGEDYSTVTKSILGNKGYNADTGKCVDMFTEGIVDPAKVTRSAFANALSTASTFITSNVAITEKKKDDNKWTNRP